MRGAHEANRHAAELMRRGPPARPGAGAGANRPRAPAGDVAEGPPERAEAPPARAEGDLGDGSVGVAEQGGGAFDPAGQEVAMGWSAEGLLEGTGKVGRRHPAHPRQTEDRPLLVGRGIHPVPGAEEAAEERRILVHRSIRPQEPVPR